jgi:putative transposase
MAKQSNIRYVGSIPLKEYDYSRAGAYFVTICAFGRKCIFGGISDYRFVHNKYGEVVDQFWRETELHFTSVKLDEYVVMPNHFHGILNILDAPNVAAQHAAQLQVPDPTQDTPVVAAQLQDRNQIIGKSPILKPIKAGSFSAIIRSFKSAVTKTIHEISCYQYLDIWQRNYYEHIIRNEDELQKIRDYIRGNPMKWAYDEENPNSDPNDRVITPFRVLEDH